MPKKLRYNDLSSSERQEFQSLLDKCKEDDYYTEKADEAMGTGTAARESINMDPGKSLLNPFGIVKTLYYVYRGYNSSIRSFSSKSNLDEFLEAQAKKRGCDSVDRSSFPGLDR